MSRLCRFTFVLIGSAAAAFGQASAVRAGSIEVGPFIGVSDGIDKFHVMGGGNVTYALNKWVLPYFEFSYFPGLPRSNAQVPNYQNCPTCASFTQTASYSMSLSDFHGGVHIRLPIRESRFVPYLVFAVGGLYHGDEHVLANAPGAGIYNNPVNIAGGTDFAVNGGGGVRYYIGGSGTFGFRAEGKVYHATSGPFSGTNFGKIEAGFFFQLH